MRSSSIWDYGFSNEVIALAAQRYLRFRLSSAGVVELCAARSSFVAASALHKQVQHITPQWMGAQRKAER